MWIVEAFFFFFVRDTIHVAYSCVWSDDGVVGVSLIVVLPVVFYLNSLCNQCLILIAILCTGVVFVVFTACCSG